MLVQKNIPKSILAEEKISTVKYSSSLRYISFSCWWYEELGSTMWSYNEKWVLKTVGQSQICELYFTELRRGLLGLGLSPKWRSSNKYMKEPVRNITSELDLMDSSSPSWRNCVSQWGEYWDIYSCKVSQRNLGAALLAINACISQLKYVRTKWRAQSGLHSLSTASISYLWSPEVGKLRAFSDDSISFEVFCASCMLNRYISHRRDVYLVWVYGACTYKFNIWEPTRRPKNEICFVFSIHQERRLPCSRILYMGEYPIILSIHRMMFQTQLQVRI